VIEKSKGSMPNIKLTTTPKPTTTTTTTTTTQKPTTTTTEPPTTQKHKEVTKSRVATIVTNQGLRSSTARAPHREVEIPRLETIFNFANDLRSLRALNLVTEGSTVVTESSMVVTETPSTTHKSTTVMYTDPYSKVTTIGLNPNTSPTPSIVLATSNPEEVTPPPRFNMRIPILPPGTKSSTVNPVSSTFPNRFSARRENNLWDETTQAVTSTPESSSTTALPTPSLVSLSSSTSYSPPTTLNYDYSPSTNSYKTLSNEISTTPAHKTTTSKPTSTTTTTTTTTTTPKPSTTPSTTTTALPIETTSFKTYSYAILTRIKAPVTVSNVVSDLDSYVTSTDAKAIIHTTTPFNAYSSLKYNTPASTTTAKIITPDIPLLEDNEVSQSSLPPPPLNVGSAEISSRGLQVTVREADSFMSPFRSEFICTRAL
jgi:hypothetical protein